MIAQLEVLLRWTHRDSGEIDQTVIGPKESGEDKSSGEK
jgi:hypothetical protein